MFKQCTLVSDILLSAEAPRWKVAVNDTYFYVINSSACKERDSLRHPLSTEAQDVNALGILRFNPTSQLVLGRCESKTLTFLPYTFSTLDSLESYTLAFEEELTGKKIAP